MSRKNKGVVLDSTPVYGVGVYEDSKARLKHQTLMQDYEELQKEADVMRSKLEGAKQKKLMLAAEVRFLRRRYKHLVRTKNTNLLQEQSLLQALSSRKQTKITKDQIVSRKEANQRKSPLIPQLNLKKKNYNGKRAASRDAFQATDHTCKKIMYGGEEAPRPNLTPTSDFNHMGRIHIWKELASRMATPSLDRDHKERMLCKDVAALRNSIPALDLNLDSSPSGKEASLPSRALIFDLNEISTGDEDFPSNVETVKLDESKIPLIKGINDDQPNDLKLSICRNAGEGSSRVGKRKISWQDPVALRV